MENDAVFTSPPPPLSVEERGGSRPAASCAAAAPVPNLCILHHHHHHHHPLDKEMSSNSSSPFFHSAGADAGCSLAPSSFAGPTPRTAVGEEGGGGGGDAASTAIPLPVDLWGRILSFLPTREVLECGKVCHRARMASFDLISSSTSSPSPAMAIHPTSTITSRGLGLGRLHSPRRRWRRGNASLASSTTAVPATRADHSPRSSSGTIRLPSEANRRVKNLEGTAARDSAVVPLTHDAPGHEKRRGTNPERFAGVGGRRAATTPTATAARSLPSSSFITQKSFGSPMTHGARRPSSAVGASPTRTTTTTATRSTHTHRMMGNGRQYLTERWERVNHVELCPPGEVLLTGYIPAPHRKLVVLAISAVDGMTDELECAVYMRRVTAPSPGPPTQGATTTASATAFSVRAKAMTSANFHPHRCSVCDMGGEWARRCHGAGSDTTPSAGCANSDMTHLCGGNTCRCGCHSSDPASSFSMMKTKKATPCSTPFAPPWAVVDDKQERDLEVGVDVEEEQWFVLDAATGLPFTTRVDVPLVFADPASHIQFQGERFLTCTSRHGDWFVFDAVLEALVELPITIQCFTASPNGRRFLVEDQGNFYYCDTDEQLQVHPTHRSSDPSTGLDATLRPHRHGHGQDDEDMWSHADDEVEEEEVALDRSDAPQALEEAVPMPQEQGRTCSSSSFSASCSSSSASSASSSFTARRRRTGSDASASVAAGTGRTTTTTTTPTPIPTLPVDHVDDVYAEREGMLIPACEDDRDSRTSISSYSYSCSCSSCSYSYSSCSYWSLTYFDSSGCSRRRRVRCRDGVPARIIDGSPFPPDNRRHRYSHCGQTSGRSHVLSVPLPQHHVPQHHPHHHHHHHHGRRDRRFRDQVNRIQRWMDNSMEETHRRWQPLGVTTGNTPSTAEGESQRADDDSQDPAAAAAAAVQGEPSPPSTTMTSIGTAVTMGNWWRHMPAPAHYHLMEEPSNGARSFAIRGEVRRQNQQNQQSQQQKRHHTASSILTASLWSLSRSDHDDHDDHDPNTIRNNSMNGGGGGHGRRQRGGLQCSPGRAVEEQRDSDVVGLGEGSFSASFLSSSLSRSAAAVVLIPEEEQENEDEDEHDNNNGGTDRRDDVDYEDGEEEVSADDDWMMEDVWQDCFGDNATRRPGGGDRSAASLPARRVHLSLESSSTPPLLVGSLKHSSAAWHHFWVGEHSILYEHEEGREVFCQDFRIPGRNPSQPSPLPTTTSTVRIGQVTDEQTGEAVPHLQCRRDCAFVHRRLHWNPLTALPLTTAIPTSSKVTSPSSTATAMAEAALAPSSVRGASPSPAAVNEDGGEDENAAHSKMTVLRSLFTATAHCLMGLSLDRIDVTSPAFYYSQDQAQASASASAPSSTAGHRSGLLLDGVARGQHSSTSSFYLSHSTVSVVAHAGGGRRHGTSNAGEKGTKDKNPQCPYRKEEELEEMEPKEDGLNTLHGFIAGAGRGRRRRQQCGSGGWSSLHIDELERRLPQGDACACDEYLFLDCQRLLLHVVQVVPPQQHQQQHEQQAWRTLVGGPNGHDASPAMRRRVVPPAKTATTPLEVQCRTHALPAHLSSNLADCRPENLLVVVPEGLHLSFKDMEDQPPQPPLPHRHDHNPEEDNHDENTGEQNQHNVDQEREDGKESSDANTENNPSRSGYLYHSRFTAGRGVWLLQMQERRRPAQFWYGGSSSSGTAWLPYEEGQGSQAGNHQRRYVMLSSDLSVCRELALGDYCDDFDGAPIVLSDRGALLFTEASSSQGTIGASLLFNAGDSGDSSGGGAVEISRTAELHPPLSNHDTTQSHGSPPPPHHHTGNAGIFGSWDPFFSGMEAAEDMGVATTTTAHNNSHGGLGASLACSVLNALGLSQAVTSGYGCLVTFPYVGVGMMEEEEEDAEVNHKNHHYNSHQEEGEEDGAMKAGAALWCRGTQSQTNPLFPMEREGRPEEQGKPMACEWRTLPPYSVDGDAGRSGAWACRATRDEGTTGAEPRGLRLPARQCCQCCCRCCRCCGCHPMLRPAYRPLCHGVGGLVRMVMDWVFGWLAARRPSPYTMATFLSFISCYTVAASLVWTISVLLSFVWWELGGGGGGAAGGVADSTAAAAAGGGGDSHSATWSRMSRGTHAAAVLGVGGVTYTEANWTSSSTSSSTALGALDAWWFALTVLLSALYITHYVR